MEPAKVAETKLTIKIGEKVFPFPGPFVLAYENQLISGWIQKNWQKLCLVNCDCGNLVSYKALRETHLLICEQCYLASKNKPS